MGDNEAAQQEESVHGKVGIEDDLLRVALHNLHQLNLVRCVKTKNTKHKILLLDRITDAHGLIQLLTDKKNDIFGNKRQLFLEDYLEHFVAWNILW